MSWTQERFERAKALWKEGRTAEEIANLLGGTTRNAVLSKMHRHGIEQGGTAFKHRSKTLSRKPSDRPPTPKKPAFNREMRVADHVGFPAEPFVPVHEEIEIPLHERKQLVDLEAGDCRWPIGDPQKSDFHFCGRGKVTGLPYCEHHARKAYQQSAPVRRRSEEKSSTDRALVDA